MIRTGSLQVPDVPNACVRCGTPYGLTRQPLLVRRGGGRIRYVDVPFCPRCWRLHESTRSVFFVAAGVATASLVIGLAVSVISQDWVPAAASVVFATATVFVARAIRRRALPVVRYERGSDPVVVIPTVGEVRIVTGGE